MRRGTSTTPPAMATLWLAKPTCAARSKTVTSHVAERARAQTRPERPAPPTAMELTSYGSGTHGYLPPECYEGDASRIDTKVDVFSAGVVFYVMLFYPHKPFFRQANQAEIMQMQPHAIRAETQALAFPAKVSADAQALLRRCLNPNRDERPDVLALLALGIGALRHGAHGRAVMGGRLRAACRGPWGPRGPKRDL